MHTYNRTLIAVTIASMGLAGCLESGGQTDKNAGSVNTINTSGPTAIERGPHPVLEPLDSEFPLPNDALLFLNDTEDGTMLNGNFTDPDSPDFNPVTQALGFLDGNSVLSPFDIKISESIDPESLDARSFIDDNGDIVPNPNQNVFLIPLTLASGDSLFPGEGEVLGMSRLDRLERAMALLESEDGSDVDEANAILQELKDEDARIRTEVISVDGGTDNALRILPQSPLRPGTKYVVAMTNGVTTASGTPLVGAPNFQVLASPTRTLSNPQLQPFRDAFLPARQAASRYFDTVDAFHGDEASAPGFGDVTFATTFTTTGVDDVLLANASPVTFFDDRVRQEERKNALRKLRDGTYNLSDMSLPDSASETDRAINEKIFELLTQEEDGADELIFHEEEVPLFDQALAQLLIEARNNRRTVTFSDIARDEDGEIDPETAFILQAAAARAADLVTDVEAGDRASSLADTAEDLLDIPQARNVTIFSEKEGVEINPELEQDGPLGAINIRVYEGVITLPYYMGIPADESDGEAIQRSNWTSADFGSDVDLPLAPSDRITSLFPFAQKTEDVTVPIVVAAPSNSGDFITAADGVGGPDDRPVIIYQHAATADRSTILTLATANALLCADNDDVENCYVTVGIDMPTHGVFDEALVSDPAEGDPGMVSIEQQREGLQAGDFLTQEDFAQVENARERHFGFSAAELGEAAVPADTLDNPEPGNLFLNVQGFPNTAGNVRQATMDLLNLSASVGNIQSALNDCETAGLCDSTVSLATDSVHFLTPSISGLGGVPFPHINNAAIQAGNNSLSEIQSAAFLNTGGHLTRALENSPDLAPDLLQGLNQESDGLLGPNRTELNLYLNIFQSLLDGVDPATYAAFYADENAADVLLTSIVGTPGNEELPSDRTMPNAADDELHEIVGPRGLDFDLGPLSTIVEDTGFVIDNESSPFAGTEPLARLMGAPSTPESGGSTPVITRFLEGSHANPITAGQEGEEGDPSFDPGSSEAVFFEMALQTLALFDGRDVTTDSCIVQGTDPDTCEAPEGAEGDGDDGFIIF